MSFVSAPVSKKVLRNKRLAKLNPTLGILIGFTVFSILAAITSNQHHFVVSRSSLTKDYQFYRLLINPLVTCNSAQLFLNILLLFYTSSTLERSLSSRHYASFLLVVSLLNSIASTLFLVVIAPIFRIQFHLSPGPLAFTYSILYLYSRLVPTTYYWKVFGLTIPSRAALYLLSLQLIISDPPSSVFIALIGIMNSYAYRSNFLSLRKYRIPLSVIKIFQSITPFMENPLPRRSTAAAFGEASAVVSGLGTPSFPNLIRGDPALRRNGGAAARRAAAVTPGNQVSGLVNQWADGIGGGLAQNPTSDQIETLAAMFPDQRRETIVSTLQQNQLDVNRAAESLLSAS